MIASRARRFLFVIIASLSLGAFSASCEKETPTEKSSQKSDAQADKERLIESRKEQQQTRGELREAVKSGASKEEIEQLQKQVKEGQKAIVQDKKEIREQKLGGASKDQSETEPGSPSKETK
jgi:hypothetical protein